MGYRRRTNNRCSVILSNFQTISLHFFELDDNSKGMDHVDIIELQKMEDSSFFHFRTVSKAKIHGEKGSALKDFGISCRSSISDLVDRTSSMSEISSKLSIFP